MAERHERSPRPSRPAAKGPASTTAIRHVVSAEQAGATLAAMLRVAIDGKPWSKCRALIRTGRVKVDAESCFEDARRMRAGETLEIFPEAPRLRAPVLDDHRIIHIDHDVIVVDKPAGLISVPYDEKDRDSLLARTRETLRRSGGRAHGGDKQDGLGVVQRLDKDTTGLLVFARTRKARKHLEAQFRAHTVTRRYLAIAHGQVEARTHRSHLVNDRGDGLRGSWRQTTKPPKNARRTITHVHIEERLRGATLVACMLETGRQHQIRIHLYEDEHPLVGERIYVRGYAGKRISAVRPMLHAATLGFKHPANERLLAFESPLPRDFVEALEELR